MSALATGGLTAPPVDEGGILPADDALFVGAYCLFGIPLFALTLSKLAQFVVQRHVRHAERRAIEAPLRRVDFDLAASLCDDEGGLRLSDFVVLQMLRQGKLSLTAVRLMRARFNLLDRDASGRLSLEEATGMQVRRPGGHENP